MGDVERVKYILFSNDPDSYFSNWSLFIGWENDLLLILVQSGGCILFVPFYRSREACDDFNEY